MYIEPQEIMCMLRSISVVKGLPHRGQLHVIPLMNIHSPP